MAATQTELAERILHKLTVLDPQEAAEPDDLVKALQGLLSAHGVLEIEGLTRWTLADIPRQLEEAYVLLGASLCADDYGAATNPAWGPMGLRMVQSFVHVPLTQPRSVPENF